MVVHVDDTLAAGWAMVHVWRHKRVASVALLFDDSIDYSVAADAEIQVLLLLLLLLDEVVKHHFLLSLLLHFILIILLFFYKNNIAAGRLIHNFNSDLGLVLNFN